MWIVIVSCIMILIYVYVVYPVLLRFLPGIHAEARVTDADTPYQPTVTLIIPAYNELQVIRHKLENSLAIDYPKDRLEIIVASDGSDDGTNDVVGNFESQGIDLRAYSPRSGKISVLNRTIVEARGEIIVLCDANVMFDPKALGRMASHFADPMVGAVTGDVRIRSEDAPFGESEGLYYRYERFIQMKESAIGSTVAVDGGMYALRKNLYHPLPADTILDDFVIGMNVALSGHRVVYDPTVLASENATVDVRQEFRRKVRIVAGAFRELIRGHAVPGPRHGQLFWSYVSHKLLRWLIPWFLLVIFCCSLILMRHDTGFSILLLVGAQLAFYSCALLGATRPNARWPAIIGIPFYFCMVNAAAWLGSLRGICGVEQVTWKKATR